MFVSQLGRRLAVSLRRRGVGDLHHVRRLLSGTNSNTNNVNNNNTNTQTVDIININGNIRFVVCSVGRDNYPAIASAIAYAISIDLYITASISVIVIFIISS